MSALSGATRRRSLLLAAACAGAFALLSATVLLGPAPGWDVDLFRAVYVGDTDASGTGSAAVEAAFPLLVRVADSRAIVAFVVTVALLLFALGRRQDTVLFLAAVSLTGTSRVLKPLLSRDSPFISPGDASFPSGHAIASATVAGGLLLILASTGLRWPAAIGGVLLVGAVGVSAVADGGHFPTDVLGGWLLAAAWVLALRGLFRSPGPAVRTEGPHSDRPAIVRPAVRR